MSGPRIVPASMDHVPAIADRARQADIDELWAASRDTPAGALGRGVRFSSHAWTGLVGDDPVCMFGVVPLSIIGGIGVPWMIGTDLIERHQVSFLRRSRPCVRQMRSLYDVLVNWVDDRNTVAHRWLRWLGFTIHDAEPHGPDGALFRRFDWRRGHV